MNQRGFTLIETFIAITVLLFAILGPMTLVSRSIADASYAANQITAFYLAQEGLELIINQREQNENLSDDQWLVNLDNCVIEVGGPEVVCKVYLDAESSQIVAESCPVEGCERFVLDNEGRYTYDDLPGIVNPKQTLFSRKVSIRPLEPVLITTSGGELDELTIDAVVDVTVDWDDKGRNRSFTLSTLLTN